MQTISGVRPMYGSRELIAELKRRGHTVVLASAATQDDEVDAYLDLLDARDLADAWTTSADVDATKPASPSGCAPRSIEAAMTRATESWSETAPWDVEAARNAEVETITVVTGGFSNRCGAVAVFESVAQLCERADETRLRHTAPPAAEPNRGAVNR